MKQCVDFPILTSCGARHNKPCPLLPRLSPNSELSQKARLSPGWAKSSDWAVAETKRKIWLHFFTHLRLNLVLGSAKRLSHGLSQKVKSPSVFEINRTQQSAVLEHCTSVCPDVGCVHFHENFTLLWCCPLGNRKGIQPVKVLPQQYLEFTFRDQPNLE